MKRQYTKRNCSYWGHDARFIHEAIDAKTKKTIAYYGICKRCNKKIFISTNGKLDNAALVHLMSITLEDLPDIMLPIPNNYGKQPDYEFSRIYENKK